MDVAEDLYNIALICFLLGIGFVSIVGLAALYMFTLFLMESINDRG
jgi:hypothetical protein